jgi:hypothetical protein
VPLLKSEPFFDSLVNRLVKKRRRVTFELTRETFQGQDTETIKIYDEGGTVLGMLVFGKGKEGELILHSLNVDDWSEDAATVERLLRFLDGVAKRRKARTMRAELYISDARSTDKIETMKACGWEPRDVGRFGERASYSLIRQL